MKHLVPCPQCACHVRADETTCPFCSAELDLSSAPAPRMPDRRLNRAALWTFSATLAAGLAAPPSGIREPHRLPPPVTLS